MKYFDYMVKDTTNLKKTRGIVTGDDIRAAEDKLKSQGLTIVEITPMLDFLSIRKLLHGLSWRIKKKDIKDFFDQLSFMLSTNLQLYNALTTLRDCSVGKKQQIITQNLSESIRKGLSLHQAMNESGFFEYAAVQQVRSGEEGGNVPVALERIAHQYERELEFAGKIKNALTYPVFITVVMFAVLWVMLTMVVPTIAATLSNLGGELPLLTKIVIGASHFASKSTPYIIIITFLEIIIFKILLKQPRIRYNIDSMKLKIPIIGRLIIKLELSRFCRSLSAMQKSGITLVRSLNITQASIKNHCIKSALEKATNMVEVSGVSLAAAMSQAGGFPQIMLQLIEVGVNAGSIVEVLDKISAQYEKEIDNTIKKVTSLIEPTMILVVGALTGVVVMSLFMPIMSVIDLL